MSSCKSQKFYSVIYNNAEPTSYQSKVIGILKKKDETKIFFDLGFKNDTISILSERGKLYEGVISTNNIIGSAHNINVNNNFRKVDVALGKKKVIEILLNIKYPIIILNKENDKYLLEYRKVYKKYQ